MNDWRFGLARLALTTAAMAWSASALAVNVISGSLWHVPDAVAQAAIPANIPNRAADVTFDVASPLNFFEPSSVAAFLGSGGAFNIVEATAGTLVSPMSAGNVSTLIAFDGLVSVTNGQQFTVTHDDGLTLIIGGTDLGFAVGPTGPVTSVATYNGPSGTFAFQLVYGECCGGAAVLQVDLPFVNAPVPEPSTAALFGLGLAGAALQRRRWMAR